MDLHPHWDSTGNDAPRAKAHGSSPAPKRKPKRHGVRIPIASMAVSRRPAAIAGIILVVGLGFIYSGGWDVLSEIPTYVGQLGTQQAASSASSSLNQIRITSTGAQPASLTVIPGTTVTILNETELPYILEINGLLDDNGQPLNIPAIFSQTSESFTVRASQAPGSYRITSLTDSAFGVDLIVAGTQKTGSTFTPDDVREPQGTLGDLSDVPLPSLGNGQDFSGMPSGSNTAMLSTSSRAASGSDQTGVLPRNPYTVDSEYQHPFNAQGEPIEALFNEDGSLKTQNTHAGADSGTHRPASNVATGPEVWFIALLAALGIWSRTRKTARDH